MKKTKNMTHKAKSTSTKEYSPHESPIIKFGIVFIYVFAIIIFSYMLKHYMP